MKPWGSILINEYLRPTSSLAMGWRVIRGLDSLTFGWTDHDEDVLLEGVPYRASGGLAVTSAHTTDSLAVPTLDITAFLDVSTEHALETGRWDNSLVTMFEFCWDPLPASLDPRHVNVIRHGYLGNVRRQNMQFTAELRGPAQRLHKRIGRQYTSTCPWRFGSVECGLNVLSYTVSGTVASPSGSTPQLDFGGTSAADGTYRGGAVTITTGANAGLTREVAQFVANRFSLLRPFPDRLVGGEGYTAVIGDDKIWETCRDVFHNGQRFGGFPHIPGMDKVYSNVTGY